MLLGKRPRPPMKRTTSITEFTIDLEAASLPLDDPINQMMIYSRNSSSVVGDGYDNRFLSTISPRNPRRSSGDFNEESTHFLRACGLCNRRLASGRDIYMYKGDTAFCSSECRQQQIIQDERKEKYCNFLSNNENGNGGSSSTTGSEHGSTKGGSGTTVAAA